MDSQILLIRIVNFNVQPLFGALFCAVVLGPSKLSRLTSAEFSKLKKKLYKLFRLKIGNRTFYLARDPEVHF